MNGPKKLVLPGKPRTRRTPEPSDPLDALLPPMPSTRLGLSAAQIRDAMRSVLPFCSTEKREALRQKIAEDQDEWTMAVVNQEIDREHKKRALPAPH